MEHLVQFGINVDDEAIRKTVINSAEKKIIQDIELGVIANIFEGRYSNSNPIKKDYITGEYKLSQDASLNQMARDLVGKSLDKWKPEIIDKVVKEIADRLYRSKTFKENVLKEVIE